MEIRERINPQESTAQLSQLPQGGKYCGVEQWITNDVMFVTCNKLPTPIIIWRQVRLYPQGQARDL